MALVTGFVLRLGTWPQVFLGGRIWLDGPDAYYHLRRAWLTLQNWPVPPQTDMMIGPPEGGPISWPPLFDLLLATLALPFSETAAQRLELVGALLPPVLGLAEILVLAWVVRRLAGPLAAGWAALAAAVLPGVARYSLLGALDHDPLVESVVLLAVGGLAGALPRTRVDPRDVLWVALGITLLVLTWAGSVLHLALLGALVLIVELPALRAGRESVVGATLGFGSAVAAVTTLPFVLGSVWSERLGASFIGLSWLHMAVLLGAAASGLALATLARFSALRAALLAAAVLGALLLAPIALPAVGAGLTFFGRGEPFLQGVMESRPLLSLFGTFDLRAPIVRLSLLPLLIPLLLPWTLRGRGEGDRSLVFLWSWLLCALGIALVQSRYAHAAALPVAALAGCLAAGSVGTMRRGSQRLVAALAVALVALPSLAAYVPLPGVEPFYLFGRVPKIVTTGMYEACDFLREEAGPSESWSDHRMPASSSVLAPWSAGHWLIWRGRQAAVMTPLGPQGQPAFVDGVGFYLESDPQAARQLLARRRVRYVVALAEVPPLEAYVSLAGVDPDVFFATDEPPPWPLDADKYLRSVAARLTWLGAQEAELFGRRLAPLEGFREVYRSGRTRRNPFAAAFGPGGPSDVPMMRIFEVRPAASGGELVGDRATLGATGG
jgi:dolichyl-diphosphooligosaccharide--protein glycosyltransferase